MINEVEIILALVIIALVAIFIYVRSIQKEIERLNKCLYECVTEGLFRGEQEQRREIERRLDALQDYLGLETVKQPKKTLMVKKEDVA